MRRGKAAWICSTYLLLGKMACPSQKIPEDILMALTSQVLGTNDFEGTIFHEQIREMIVPEPNKIQFTFHDGNIVETSWQDPSRRDSWTEEAKAIARERRLKQKGSSA
jgi:site-specific DNA recombinase